ncbi:MAG: hypothetical protein FIA97_02640 [Methylococcaceae bacterium]|nr:hypothetical protein [Methylococcaceae bacterium]
MSDILGYEACKAELKRLLDEISANIEAAGASGPQALHAAVLSESKKLLDFTNRSEPADPLDSAEVENISQLDQLADDTRRQIFGDSARAIVGRIQDRAAQLDQLGEGIEQQSAANEGKAGRLRLKPIRNAIDALTTTADSIRQAKKTLSDDNATEAAIKADIDAVLDAISQLQDSAKQL